MSWNDRAQQRRQLLAAQIPGEWEISPDLTPETLSDGSGFPDTYNVLDSLDVQITRSTTGEILEHIKEQRWTSHRVMLAFCKRAVVAHQLTNCATNFLFTEALRIAQDHDAYLAKTGQVKGPLHGLPFSVKDCIDVAGVETTCGLVSRIGTIATDNALVIRCLKEAGAIPFMKTNLAQATLLVESTNNIFGLVTNPHNRNLSAGGSSGGEGAVVALRGSPLGIGTDGGGSIRLPAAWNGVYGLKPSATRISTLGTSGVGYSDSNLGCIGPLANDLETLSLFTKVILDARPWDIDPACIPMPWNPDVQLPRKLIIGLLLDDGITHLSPPVLRVLEETRQKLTEEGHEVIQLDWSDLHVRGSKIIFTMYTQEGGIGVKEALDASGEPAVPRLATGWSEKPLTPLEIWKNHRARKQLRLEYLQRWKLLKLDAVLTAPSPHPAPPHTQYITTALSAIYNLLDYPCCIIPAGRVDAQKDVADDAWYAQTPYNKMPDFPYDLGDADLKELYKGPHVFENAPLALQIVGLPWQEERCLLVAKVIDNLRGQE